MNISEDLKTFISKYIGSVGQLEVFLLIVSSPARRWTDKQIGDELGISVGFAAGRLLSLCVKGLLAADNAEPRSYACNATAAADALVAELLSAHKRDPMQIVKIILSDGRS